MVGCNSGRATPFLRRNRPSAIPNHQPRRNATYHSREAVQTTEASSLLTWAVSRWNAEVADRPLRNIHRRALDDIWRQVIRFAGRDPIALLGPSHDDLLDPLIKDRKSFT